MILNYKTFGSNEDFVVWQKERERKISSISPLVFGVSDEGKEPLRCPRTAWILMGDTARYFKPNKREGAQI
jgi:hypothetical protein